MTPRLALTRKWKKNLDSILESRNDGVPDRDTLISELSGTLEDYLDESAIQDIYEATLYGARAHRGQKRKSGEHYIFHPIAVARILGEMRMDSRTIIAAILHDVVEDTEVTVQELADHFGQDVASLVDGVSKVSQLEQESREHAEAESFRKMFMAMARDIRVVIIKLADRLHNVRTLDSLSEEKKRRIARQTLEIYAPMANRLGMRELTQTLQDLSFEALYPKRYNDIARRLKASRRSRKSVVDQVCKQISEKLAVNGLTAEVSGREKNIYSIYEKIQRKKLRFRDIKDINAIRIVTEHRLHCYQALGIVHQLYTPRLKNFKDYIAVPKANGYQSLHTLVMAFEEAVEVQIRSQSMNQAAEKGVASHWIYKTDTVGEHAPQQLAQQWLDSFLQAQKMSSNSGEYMEHLKADLFPDEVYVFTPKGDIKRFPRGATALDFAYAVHSDVGDHCIGAKIDDRLVPLHERLSNGDHVEVKTSRTSRPRPSWLDYAVTSRARASIRHYLGKQTSRESLSLGRKLLRTALRDQGYKRVRIASRDKVNLLKQLRLDDWQQLLMDIGSGKRLQSLVAKQLIAVSAVPTDADAPDGQRATLTIEGTEKLLITYASCCHPIPDDRIVGTTTSGRGLVVHRSNCNNFSHFSRNPDSYFHLHWSKSIKGKFQVPLHVETGNDPGDLAIVSNVIAEHRSNINRVNLEQAHPHSAPMDFVVEVSNRKHLADIIRQLRNTRRVRKVYRV